MRVAAGSNVVFPGAIYDPSIIRSLRFHTRAYLHGHKVGGTNPSLVAKLFIRTLVNRYSDRKIELDGPEVGDRLLDGAFNIGDTDAFVKGVSMVLNLEATAGAETRLRSSVTSRLASSVTTHPSTRTESTRTPRRSCGGSSGPDSRPISSEAAFATSS